MNKNNFLYQTHCEEKNGNWYPSSKRFYGGIGFIICQLTIFTAAVISLLKTGELSSIIASLIDFDLVTSASLIGLSSITRVFGGDKTSISNKQTDNEEVL